MFLTVDTKDLHEYSNYRNTSLRNSKHTKPNFKENSHKIIKGLAGLAIAGVAVAGYATYKKNINAKRIHDINYIGQSIANHVVQNSNSRGENAVNLYKKHIADKKASVLKYKLDNGMFIGKSRKAIKHIKKNLKQLEIDAL